MRYYRQRQDDALLAEAYTLLVETPTTEANIEKFMKKYLSREIGINLASARENHNPPFGPGGPFDEKKALHDIKNMYRSNVMFDLEAWTPGVQQAIRASGGISDIFGYSDLSKMRQARDSVSVSKTAAKKAYKKAEGMEKIYETDQFVFFKPETWEASRKYFGMPRRISLLDGELKPGASWCTSSSDPKYFTEYVNKNRDRLIYIIHKSDDVLWAVRSRTMPRNKSITIFNHFDQELLQYITYMQDEGEYEDYGNISAYDQLVVDAIHDVELDTLKDKNYGHPLLEVRDQENSLHNLSGMISKYFIDLQGEKDVTDKILPFIGLVVFGIMPNK